MSLMDGFVIAFVCLFVINLIVLITYVGPILKEIKGILADVRSITTTSQERIRKIDSVMEKASLAIASVRGVSGIMNFFRRFSKKKNGEE